MRVLNPKARELLLDKKDWRVLREVVFNMRQPLSQIAKKCFLSRQAVEYRLKLLQQNHLIAGSRAVINIQKLGYSSFHIFIEVHTPEEENIIIERSKQAKFVNAIIRYSGKYNVEISVIARSPDEFLRYYQQLIHGVRIRDDHILLLLTTIASQVLPRRYFPQLQELQESTFGVSRIKPRKPEPAHLDVLDVKLLFHLSQDALISNISLAKIMNVSKDTITYRIKRLESSGYLLHYRPIINFSVLGLFINSVLIKLNHSLKSSKDFENYIRSQGSSLWATRTFGYYDYLIYVITKDLEEFHDFINAVKEQFHDMIKTYEILFAYEQLKYSYMTESIIENVVMRKKKPILR